MNKFKTILLLILLTAISLSSSAQRRDKQIFTPSHEFKLGIGIAPIILESDDYSYNNYYNNFHPSYGYDFSKDRYEDLLVFRDSYTSSAYSFGYSYNILRWLSAGAILTYANNSFGVFDRLTDKIINKSVSNYLIVTPTVRFTYLNRPLVKLYSQVGLGVRTELRKDQNEEVTCRSNSTVISGNFTYFGISVGRKLFGFSELCVGSQGTFVIGIGYKFNSKK